MKISELNTGQGNVEVEGTISEVGEVRTFNKFGRDLKVANAVLQDDSGTIKLSLWNDDAERFKKDDKVKISNGYVNEFQGEKQLTSGKYGTIEKVGGDSSQESLPSEEAPTEEPATEPEEAPTETPEEPKEEVF